MKPVELPANVPVELPADFHPPQFLPIEMFESEPHSDSESDSKSESIAEPKYRPYQFIHSEGPSAAPSNASQTSLLSSIYVSSYSSTLADPRSYEYSDFESESSESLYPNSEAASSIISVPKPKKSRPLPQWNVKIVYPPSQEGSSAYPSSEAPSSDYLPSEEERPAYAPPEATGFNFSPLNVKIVYPSSQEGGSAYSLSEPRSSDYVLPEIKRPAYAPPKPQAGGFAFSAANVKIVYPASQEGGSAYSSSESPRFDHIPPKPDRPAYAPPNAGGFPFSAANVKIVYPSSQEGSFAYSHSEADDPAYLRSGAGSYSYPQFEAESPNAQSETEEPIPQNSTAVFDWEDMQGGPRADRPGRTHVLDLIKYATPEQEIFETVNSHPEIFGADLNLDYDNMIGPPSAYAPSDKNASQTSLVTIDTKISESANMLMPSVKITGPAYKFRVTDHDMEFMNEQLDQGYVDPEPWTWSQARVDAAQQWVAPGSTINVLVYEDDDGYQHGKPPPAPKKMPWFFRGAPRDRAELMLRQRWINERERQEATRKAAFMKDLERSGITSWQPWGTWEDDDYEPQIIAALRRNAEYLRQYKAQGGQETWLSEDWNRRALWNPYHISDDHQAYEYYEDEEYNPYEDYEGDDYNAYEDYDEEEEQNGDDDVYIHTQEENDEWLANFDDEVLDDQDIDYDSTFLPTSVSSGISKAEHGHKSGAKDRKGKQKENQPHSKPPKGKLADGKPEPFDMSRYIHPEDQFRTRRPRLHRLQVPQDLTRGQDSPMQKMRDHLFLEQVRRKELRRQRKEKFDIKAEKVKEQQRLEDLAEKEERRRLRAGEHGDGVAGPSSQRLD